MGQVLLAATLVGGLVGIGSAGYSLDRPSLDTTGSATRAAGQLVTGCRVTDGDTIRCGRERVRLLGIDAPELPGHCNPGRRCVPGDPYASTDSLAAAMAPSMRVERVGRDRYGRTLGLVAGPRGDLSCWQLERRQAIYRGDWDDGGRLAARCRAAR